MNNIPLKSEFIREAKLYIFVALYLVSGFLITLLLPEYWGIYYLGAWIGPAISALIPYIISRELSFHYWFKGDESPKRKYDFRVYIKQTFAILFVIIILTFSFLFYQIHPDTLDQSLQKLLIRGTFFGSILVFLIMVCFYTNINTFVENKSKIKHDLQLIKRMLWLVLIMFISLPFIFFISQEFAYLLSSVAALLLALRYFFKGRRYFLTDKFETLKTQYENTKN